MRIVLASSSPSRKKILRDAGVDPLIQPADVDEDALLADCADLPPALRVQRLAAAKAHAIAADYPDDIIIGGDSMLLLDGKLSGKPHTIDRAIEQWKTQRGRTATLLSGHCIIAPTRDGQRAEVLDTSSTDISFADVTDVDIAAYAHTREPLGCAGAFTLEAIGGWFIDRIEGDPSGVIGLSLPLVRRALYSFGINVADVFTTAD